MQNVVKYIQYLMDGRTNAELRSKLSALSYKRNRRGLSILKDFQQAILLKRKKGNSKIRNLYTSVD